MRFKRDDICARMTDAAMAERDKVSLHSSPFAPPTSEQHQSPVPLSCICKSFMRKSQDAPSLSLPLSPLPAKPR